VRLRLLEGFSLSDSVRSTVPQPTRLGSLNLLNGRACKGESLVDYELRNWKYSTGSYIRIQRRSRWKVQRWKEPGCADLMGPLVGGLNVTHDLGHERAKGYSKRPWTVRSEGWLAGKASEWFDGGGGALVDVRAVWKASGVRI
jgi:hypothetical protein